jgi:hypothetical protein
MPTALDNGRPLASASFYEPPSLGYSGRKT